ncbi:winged helix-turn-helix domain-containing protein [Microbispora bryophytorum]|uniref:GntR family transcriptional regulator n=1 Tax=Microbispora bryophytorum TaxID=1460882 RepID=UPI0033E18BF7
MIDFRPDQPRYEQVADVIRQRIRDGEYRPGFPIPSINRLCQEFGVAKNTADKAVRALRASGDVYTVPDMGSFVMTDEVRKQLASDGDAAAG